jgi:hypothetical protein
MEKRKMKIDVVVLFWSWYICLYFKVSVSGTAPGSIPHDIALKVTQIPGGQLSEATGFAINPESVVQVKQGENISVTTSENLKVNNVKVRNVQGQQVDLLPLTNNLWSLRSLVPGSKQSW